MAIKSLAKIGPVTFLQEVRDELSKVIWPSRNETVKMTIIVIVVSVVVGIFIGGLDLVFTKTTELLIKK